MDGVQKRRTIKILARNVIFMTQEKIIQIAPFMHALQMDIRKSGLDLHRIVIEIHAKMDQLEEMIPDDDDIWSKLDSISTKVANTSTDMRLLANGIIDGMEGFKGIIPTINEMGEKGIDVGNVYPPKNKTK